MADQEFLQGDIVTPVVEDSRAWLLDGKPGGKSWYVLPAAEKAVTRADLPEELKVVLRNNRPVVADTASDSSEAEALLDRLVAAVLADAPESREAGWREAVDLVVNSEGVSIAEGDASSFLLTMTRKAARVVTFPVRLVRAGGTSD